MSNPAIPASVVPDRADFYAEQPVLGEFGDVEGKVVQDAREVCTKFSKTITTWFFPVGDDIRQIAVDWIGYLTNEKLLGPADPLFPATQVVQDQDYQFKAGGLSRQHWANATPIRMIFREAFGLPYVNPHSFRETWAQLGERLCRTPEEFKAWSQNLGHEQVLTTFSSYGQVAANRQAELIRRLGQRQGTSAPKVELIERVIQVLQDGKHTFE